jgi:hypothetical protein
MVQRGERPIAVPPRHIGYPSPFRGQVRGTQGSLPCFPSMGLSSRRPPFLRRVPASPVPRPQRYYEGATTSRARDPGPLWFRPQAPSAPPVFVLAEALPAWRRTIAGPGVFGQPVSPSPASRTWARTGSLRFPGSPSYAFALFQDPGRTSRTSPLAVLSMLPPVPTLRRLQRDMISGLPQGFSVRCLRFTSGVAAAHARLASGWRAAPLPGGDRTLWTAMKGFRLHPSSFPGLS